MEPVRVIYVIFMLTARSNLSVTFAAMWLGSEF
jgi:hypothetical protein